MRNETLNMKKIIITSLSFLTIASLLLSACQRATPTSQSAINVLAVETFLAEIAQNVAGERLKVEALVPLGLDPHAFEPTPRDVIKIAESQVLILNGSGFEAWAAKTLENAGGQRIVIEASAGLTSRTPREGEPADEHDSQTEEAHIEGDPHFWLDPTQVIRYVENIRDGLITADPAGKDAYTQNAAAYIAQLNDLDTWITQQVSAIPEERRLIVTNHESFGYFADRYGFTIIGTVIPSVSTGASPSAQQLARLVDQIRATGAVALFLETGANPQLAEQIAQETGLKVVSGLYTHSITAPGGEAPTYIRMMQYNVNVIVGALK
jgi:ABC-type Zn uptake system ZnuABC Zn-binding protein ZnuA